MITKMSFTQAASHQHRKKKYVFKERESPFPVPIASVTRDTPSKNYWYHYTGQIQGDFILVTHSGDISYLNRMGFFGKGLMSRGEPSVYKDLPVVHLPSARDTEPDVVHVMRRRMFLKHVKWKKAHDLRLTNEKGGEAADKFSVTSEDQEFDSDVECYQQGLEHDSNKEENETDQHMHKDTVIQKFQNESSVLRDTDMLGKQSNDTACSSLANQNSTVWSWDEEMANQKPLNDLWENTTSNQNSAAESWDAMEADEDFWASEDVKSDSGKIKDDIMSESDNTEILSAGSSAVKRELVDKNAAPVSPIKKMKLCHDGSNTNGKTNEEYDKTFHHSKINCESSNLNSESQFQKCCDVSDEVESKSNEHSDGEITAVLKMSEENKQNSCSVAEKEIETKHSVDVKIKFGEDCVSENNQDNIVRDFPENLPVHPYCLSDEEGDDTVDEVHDDKITFAENEKEYLIIDDSDIDDSTEVLPRKNKYSWIPVRKKEVFNFNEPLVLSFEEAFFLSYGLGCLTVLDENETSLSLTDMWCRFCKKAQFLPRYVTYHYFRSKGWVPKPSILFGTDFLVYKVGPEFYHASYSVIVKTVYADTYEEVEGCNMKTTWTSFFGLNRTTERVAKTLIYCYVIMPRDLTEEERSSPECISRFKVRLQTIHRWVSSQEREKDKVLNVDDIT